MIKPFLRSALVLTALWCSAAPAAAAVTVVMDAPRANTTLRVPFALGGWALDTASTSGTGVSTMHVWAFPTSGASPVFLGVTAWGPRPDVASIYGSRFTNSGFNLGVYSLAPGGYTIVVYPFSTRLNAFDYARAYALPVTITTGQTTTTTTGTALRVLQWNLHHSVGTDGVYNPDRIATWAAKMNPDVVMFNEIEKFTYWGNQDQPELYKALLQQKTGRTWYYVFAQEFGDWSSKGKGNLILSRFPINAADRYELTRNYDRSIAMAAITVGGIPISLINTHLDPYDATLRLAQASEVTWWSGSQPENRILTGDMNAWPDQSSIGHITQTYYDSWAVAANQGTAVAFSGNTGQTKSGRIDYIFYSKGSRNLSVKSSQVYDTRDANGVMPSDHRPVVTTFIVK